MLRLWIAAVLLFCGPLCAEPMRMENECMGNAYEACYIILDGEITDRTPPAFEAFLESTEGGKVLLNSGGGNLEAGLEVGRIIRKHGLQTEIGRTAFEEYEVDGVRHRRLSGIDPGQCVSACAYAFLGGQIRSVAQDSRLGFHRVSLTGGGSLPGEGGLAAGQLVAAALITYLAEMGIDTRIFVQASEAASAAMHYPARDALLEFGLVTLRGYDRFQIEPYNAGIIAVSRRRDSTDAYDHAFQVTAYCREDRPYLLVTASNPFLGTETNGFEGTTFDLHGQPFPLLEFRIRSDETNSYLTFGPDPSLLAAIGDGGTLRIGYFRDRASGGYHGMKLDLTASDRDMLAAAFRFCI